tara:strand:- start:39710 stop:39895 length:186 start_codon:yes stop_codon:yes gene_type:complete
MFRIVKENRLELPTPREKSSKGRLNPRFDILGIQTVFLVADKRAKRLIVPAGVTNFAENPC